MTKSKALLLHWETRTFVTAMNESPPSASEWLMVNGWGNFVQNKIVTQLQAVHSIAYNSLILPITGQYSQVELSTAQYSQEQAITAQ